MQKRDQSSTLRFTFQAATLSLHFSILSFQSDSGNFKTFLAFGVSAHRFLTAGDREFWSRGKVREL